MLAPEQLDFYENNGFVVLEPFLTDEEVSSLKVEVDRIVEEFQPGEDSELTIFTGDNNRDKRTYHHSQYFMESADKIRFFFEEEALDESGNLVVSKQHSLNKIGHALHWWNPVFRKITFSLKVKQIAKDLRLVDPAIIQSMYIFKNPRIGAAVSPHQDGTYLYCEPMRLHGFWIALDDASERNGCLWFLPGSHKDPVQRRMVRVPGEQYKVDYSGKDKEIDESKLVPVPVKKGGCVLIHGQVVHKSEKNLSKKPRPAYTFHVLDQYNTTFSTQNWLQPTPTLGFQSLYLNAS